MLFMVGTAITLPTTTASQVWQMEKADGYH